MSGKIYGIKAQNFDATIFDTEDLSTIRGASLAAIDAIPKDNLNEGVAIVSAGGSAGIYHFDSSPASKGSQVNLEKFDAAKHLCFSEAEVACTSSYVADKASLSALHSRNQMRNRGVVYPAWGSKAKTVCPIDLLRPATSTKHRYKGQEIHVSSASYDRRQYGLGNKQVFLKRLACDDKNHDIFKTSVLVETHSFAMLLSSISDGQHYDDELKPTLRDKIAVIHFDGNGAGAMQTQLLQAVDNKSYKEQLEVQRDFDKKLAVLRQSLAEVVLDVLSKNKGVGPPSSEEKELRKEIKKSADQVIRFEALLWAGDEITFIVPARLGWQVAQAILAVLEKPNGSAKIADKLEKDGYMRGAIGLIYCHHDAPIARIRKLADRLCTHCKEVDRKKNLVFPIVLESFDHIGPDLDDYLGKRTPQNGQLTPDEINRFFVLDSAELAQLAEDAEAKRVDEAVSRREVRRAAYDAHRNAIITASSARNDELKTLRANMLIEEYWDYYPKAEKDAKTGDGS
jgi:hypothetical protein